MSDYKSFTYSVGNDTEVTNYYSADTIYYAIADIIFEDNIYDIVKDKLTNQKWLEL